MTEKKYLKPLELVSILVDLNEFPSIFQKAPGAFSLPDIRKQPQKKETSSVRINLKIKLYASTIHDHWRELCT